MRNNGWLLDVSIGSLFRPQCTIVATIVVLSGAYSVGVSVVGTTANDDDTAIARADVGKELSIKRKEIPCVVIVECSLIIEYALSDMRLCRMEEEREKSGDLGCRM